MSCVYFLIPSALAFLRAGFSHRLSEDLTQADPARADYSGAQRAKIRGERASAANSNSPVTGTPGDQSEPSSSGGTGSVSVVVYESFHTYVSLCATQFFSTRSRWW